MRKMILAAALASLSFAATAQHSATSPVGKWKTLDDKTGKVMTISEVYEAKNGTLAAKIVENVGNLPANCTTCSGDHKGKPIVGMVTLWNLKANKDGTWGGGNGYKPSEDRHFKVKSVELIDSGERVRVTGCVLFICKKAEWVRVH